MENIACDNFKLQSTDLTEVNDSTKTDYSRNFQPGPLSEMHVG